MSLGNTFCHLEGDLSLSPGERIHMVGIGGIGMQGLALLALGEGFLVSGSDREERAGMNLLGERGIDVFIGEDPQRVEGAAAVVYSLAVSEECAEIKRARERGIPLYSRADLLGFLGKRYPIRIGIAGTHGKSTVTAMVGQILRKAGWEPTVVCGAFLQGDTPFWQGRDEVLVYEACEYGDSFLATSPTVAAVTNVEFDHPDWFRSGDAVRSSFLRFLRKPTVKTAVLPAEEPLRASLPGDRPCYTFGHGGAVSAKKLSQKNGCVSFLLTERGGDSVGVNLGVPGLFQLENALCAAAVCLAVGVDLGRIAEGLESYAGIGRRMEKKGLREGIAFYVDYAHHPTEIALSLATARELAKGRLITVFQPHTYSRTRALFDGFVRALREARCLAILAPYGARETKDPLRGAERLAEDLRVTYLSDRENAAAWIRKMAREGDTVLLLGAGDVNTVFDAFNPREECEGPEHGSCRSFPPSPREAR